MNKRTKLAVILFALMCSAVFAQQYDSESDFLVRREGNEITITGYTGKNTVIKIPPKIQDLPVTIIGEKAFGGQPNITSVTLPDTVTVIQDKAFNGCYELNKVNIPEGVTYIGSYAFMWSGITSISIPKSVTFIAGGAFGGCPRLQAINVNANNTEYSSLDGVLYDKGKTILHTYPAGRRGTSNFKILPTLTNIGDFAFAGCDNIASVTIHNLITNIGMGAFLECSNLTAIYVNADNTVYSSVDGVLYDKGKTFLHTYPSGKYKTPDYSFTIPDGVKFIEYFSFYGNKRLKKIIIPSSVTDIQEYAFCRCNFTEITFKGTIFSYDLAYNAFEELGDLRAKFYETDKSKGTPGTYTREKNVWTRQ